jgi:hypothetical protein
MKKTQSPKPDHEAADLRAEYRLDYQKARPNRFAEQTKENRIDQHHAPNQKAGG